jgi:malonate decarboxylase epsilon subunit
MIAFLFPGQGSQRPGLLSETAAAFDAYELFKSASAVLGFDVLRDDDERALKRTEIVQRNIFLAGVAGARALERAGIRAQAVAGHSIGAFAAATTAGVISFDDALTLVDRRGRAMARAFGPGYAMAAICGLGEREVATIAGSLVAPDAAYVAGVNAPDQVVISGSERSVEESLEIARARGARTACRLEIDVPSHTPLMNGVRAELEQAFATVALHRSAIAIAANVDGRALFDQHDVARDLIDGVALPVRWYDATQMLFERGVDCFIEAFLGETLTALAESAFPEACTMSLGRVSLGSAIARARRHVAAH